jgi:hypothetical protein
MSSNDTTNSKKYTGTEMEFDFEEWHRLSKESPQRFEQKRQQVCQQLIDAAPEKYRRRLNGLMFQIEMNRRKAANPMDSCIRLSRMMWDSYYELFDQLNHLLEPPSNQRLGMDECSVVQFKLVKSTT